LPYTQTVEAAAKWVKDFRPKMVFPYHYRNQDGSTSDMAAFSTQVAMPAWCVCANGIEETDHRFCRPAVRR